ncbi:MAG: MBL fold metallo-hydrolase [Verrucomicrobia bacterium]|nr:MBL fold metallo-hydrolase [Verrucomicrobiota bacterium]
MNLEDHLGDVLMKGRLHAGVSAAAAAQAAKLTEAELTALEETGQPPRAVDFTALGKLLGLAPARLEALAHGWQPAPVSLDRWRELRQITTQGGSFSVNCYLVWDEASRDAALFDTGFAATPIFALLDENELQLRHVFITHSHGDHVAALGEIRARYPKARLHRGAPDAPVDQRNRPNEFLQLGSLRITHRATPGHADDGFTYLVGNWPEDAPHVAIIGDTLFAGSMGKVTGDAAAAREVIRTQILSLPPPTLLCPGHGPLTTVAEERDHNPFF